MMSAWPRAIDSIASPTAWPPVAQALTMAMFGPRMPYWMATMPRGGVRNHVRDQERRDPTRSALVQGQDPVRDHADAADGGADHHAEPIRIGLGGVELAAVVQQAGMAQRLTGGGHREVGVAVVPADVTRVHVLGGVEALDLAGHVDVVAGGVECGDVGDAGAAGDQALPVGIGADADR